MRSKAQITVFFVVGIVIVMVVFLSNALKQEKVPLPSKLGSDTDELDLYLKSCLQQVGEDAVYEVMMQGGYYAAPGNSLQLLQTYIPFYWQDNLNNMPSKSEIERELALYVYYHMSDCVDYSSVLSDMGYERENKDVPFGSAAILDGLDEIRRAAGLQQNSVDTLITDISVQYVWKTPIKFMKGSETFSYNNVESTVNIDLNEALGYADIFLATQQLAPNYIPLSALSVLAYENGFEYELLSVSDNEVLVTFAIPQEFRDDLLYSFAIQYVGEEP